MRIVFMGTPESAVPSLRQCLNDGHEVIAVWTQPDKSSGRGHKMSLSPVKEFAVSQGLTVHQPSKIKVADTKALFASHQADVAVVVAYGRILPAEFLSAPRHGCVNVHFSLLPKYRGAAPVNWAIINGEEKTGVTTMVVEEELDSGPILLQSETPVHSEETAAQLMDRLASVGAELLSQTLGQFGSLTPQPQSHDDATFAPILKRQDGLIDWFMDAFAIERRVRGFQPWPNAYSFYNSRRLIVWRAFPKIIEANEHPPGTIIAAHGDDLIVKCGADTALSLLEVQTEGGRRINAREYLNGARMEAGRRLQETQ
ncbi:MAG: methionyl-tRNA formyltransferase [Blastocatellia bacterium]|jgi:methionyl-tRNA formyltransferase|nr:methionyl-tRNA formyltransferase [Blastocatellia bacterium]